MSTDIDPPPKSDIIRPFAGNDASGNWRAWQIWRQWFDHVHDRLRPGPFKIRAYNVAELPDANKWGDNDTFSSIVYVIDEVGGPVLAYSDGTDWRRVGDGAVVS